MTYLSEGFLQSEVLGEVSVLAKFEAKFLAKFSGLFCWDIQGRKKFSKKLQPKIPTTLHSKTGEYSGNNFMTRFCRGNPAKTYHPPGNFRALLIEGGGERNGGYATFVWQERVHK